MRELKFRAWKKPNGIEKGFMYFPERLFLNRNGKVWHIDGEKFSNSYVLEHGFAVLMQYTGLKDKNSVEIYEGDILAFEDDKFVWSVEYDLCCFVANGGEYNQKEELIEFYDWKEESLDVVIIGNIYEHPHLLENNQ